MKKYSSILLLCICLLFWACEEEPETDTTPPTVSITHPEPLSSVSEITSVTCIATDNDSVQTVELWIDSMAMGIFDSISPYELPWNTVPYPDSSEHIITVRAEDLNNNISDSEPVIVTVNNSTSHPQAVNIISIVYTLADMTITFEQSTDSDFFSYELLRSGSEEGNKNSLGIFSSINDTVIHITNFDPLTAAWYWIRTADIHGYTSTGSGYYILDDPPLPVTLDPVVFLDSLFVINWSRNTEDDFHSYSVFESLNPTMSSAVEVFQSTDSIITEFNHFEIEESQYRYYQVVVKDYWGLMSASNIEMGTSWTLFNETYGDFSYDYGRCVLQTLDEGYIVAGNTSTVGNSFSNVLLVKTDVQGNQEWIKSITFSATDRGNAVTEGSDGGFIVVGNTISENDGSQDVLLLKTDGIGTVEWHQAYGTNQDEIGNSVYPAADGGYIICGQAVSANTGFNFAYLIKVDGSGNESWSRTFGADANDYGYSVIQANDGGYAIAGMTRSSGDSDGDAWLIKTDGDGQQEWSQTYGGDGTESARAIQQTVDGGFILLGHTNSFGSGNNDAFLVKTDAAGNQQWSQTYGGTATDHGRSVDQTDDGGYIIAGYTDSFGTNGFDFWLIKTDTEGNLEWHETYTDYGDDRGLWGQQTVDGGYVITGYSDSNSNSVPDVVLVKTDHLGNTD